jgi:predicted enzyme related to lactoylglutathione lyase
MDYSLFEAPSGPGGGVGGLQPGNWREGIINYISVNSVEEYESKVTRAGGKIIMPKAEVPGQGWFAVFEDPAGTRMALWQQNPEAIQPPQQPPQQEPQRRQQPASRQSRG